MDIIIVLLLTIIIILILRQQNADVGGLLKLGKKRAVILDSCTLIDGRVAELVRTGFLDDRLVIPQFILNELQLLADGNDSHKRERARFGLDIAHELQDSAPEVEVDRSNLPQSESVDDKLIALAKKRRAYLFTSDYNLAKVAAVEGVSVLNVNELAQQLRPIALPGETLQIKILQKGSNRDQGVGYLEDGTMIVIANGAQHIGSTVPVTVTRMHQTVAGKMVFGQAAKKAKPSQHSARKQSNSPLAKRFTARKHANTSA